MLTFEDCLRAQRTLEGVARKTPVLTSSSLDRVAGAKLFLKAENFQRTGSFKFRGAYNALSMLSDSEKRAGVVAASSGNHAQAIALAGQLLNIDIVVVAPSDAPLSKMAATKSYGAKVVEFDRKTEDREAIQAEISRKEGRVIVPAYDHYGVMAGQSTLALELIAQSETELDALILPVSGGGMLAGCGTVFKSISPQTRIYGAEPKGADDTLQSFISGSPVRLPSPSSIADGLQAPTPGRLTFPINQSLLTNVFTATDEQLEVVIGYLALRQKIVIEPSGVAGLAALLAHREEFIGQKVGVVLSGGNIDGDMLARIVERGTEEYKLLF